MASGCRHLHLLNISHLPYLPHSHHSHLSSPLSPSPSLPHQFPKFRMEAALNGNMEATKVPTSVPVRVAYELLLAGHKYLDVRTPEEFDAGHAPDAVNIPYMFRARSGMTKNPNFLEEVSSQFRKDDEIRKEYIIIIRKSCNDQIQYSIKRHQDIEGSPSYTGNNHISVKVALVAAATNEILKLERCTLIFYTTGSQLAFSPDGANAAGSVFVETLLFQLLRQTIILAPVRIAQKQLAEANKREAVRITTHKAELAASQQKAFCISHVDVGLDVAALHEVVTRVM
ncbi:hypothetical protein RIF29_29791 [Crotalaria pallida]|uniref:Rhodanese domain-containing protein n=1 Tax=Crotalaria pallida TaxID=3830 RepID=A0AAN9EF70_CROPI